MPLLVVAKASDDEAAVSRRIRNDVSEKQSDIEDGGEEEEDGRPNDDMLGTGKASAVISDSAEKEGRGGFVDYAKLVWDVTAQNTKAPVAHERIVLFMVLLWSTIISIVALGGQYSSISIRASELIVGITVNANLVFFYGAPLSTIFAVLKTRSSSSIHIPTMIWNTANGVFWAAFGSK